MPLWRGARALGRNLRARLRARRQAAFWCEWQEANPPMDFWEAFDIHAQPAETDSTRERCLPGGTADRDVKPSETKTTSAKTPTLAASTM